MPIATSCANVLSKENDSTRTRSNTKFTPRFNTLKPRKRRYLFRKLRFRRLSPECPAKIPVKVICHSKQKRNHRRRHVIQAALHCQRINGHVDHSPGQTDDGKLDKTL